MNDNIMKVKGTWLVDVVRLIRVNRDKDYSKWLRPEEWEIINSKILSSVWYPFESYKRIGLAGFHVGAGGDVNLVRLFGQNTMRGLVQIYKSMAVEGDPAASVAKFCNLAQNFFRGLGSHYEITGQGEGWMEVKLKIAPEDELGELSDVFGYQIAGNVDELLKQTGVKKARLDITKAADGFAYRVTWDPGRG